MSNITATPAKLKSGAWGARVAGHVHEGDTITMTTRSGKSWQATIARVLWTGDGVSICATASADSHYDANKFNGYGARRGGYVRGDGGPRGSRPCYMCGSYYCDGARGGLCEDD